MAAASAHAQVGGGKRNREDERVPLTLEDVSSAVAKGDTSTLETGLAQEGEHRLNLDKVIKWSFPYWGVFHGKAKTVWWLAACRLGHMQVVKVLLGMEGDRYVNVHAQDSCAVRWAAEYGQLEMLQMLLALEGDRRMDVHALEEYAFRWACQRGHIDIVKYLLTLEEDRRVDVHAGQGFSLQVAAHRGHLDIVQLLLELEGDRWINVHAMNEEFSEILADTYDPDIRCLLEARAEEAAPNQL